MNSLKGKTAIITGAGSGMGRAMAVLFAAEGASIVASDVAADRLDELKREIAGKGGNINVVTSNVAAEDDCDKLTEAAVAAYGTIDILVNNAGVLDNFMPVADTTAEVWNRVMGVNLHGPFFMMRAVLKYMLKQGSGNVINIASVGGLFGSRAGAAYTASKHALVGLTKNTAFMYAASGIRCNAIAPGGVNTRIAEHMQPHPLGYQRMSLGMGTMPRVGEAAEIAAVALFLASDASGFINGAVITADAGWTAY